jgi:hypothetical protein
MSRVSASVREQVRKRAQERCEYCRKPETAGGFSYQVDHVIPEKHLGTSSLENLAWACFKCNNAKATDIASYDADTGTLTPLYNPRIQAWNEHFELLEGIVLGRTAVGRVTVRVLEMNSPIQIEVRRLLVEAGLWESS